jgi:photoactive yellow protein
MNENQNELVEDAPAIHSVERLAEMSSDEVDDLPYGFIILDERGDVVLYNRYEAAMSRMPPERVLGRNFFADIAPCTRVAAFQGRFQALVADGEARTDRFTFRFHFLHGAQDVIVQLAKPIPRRRDGGAELVFMTVARTRLPAHGPSAQPEVATNDETGSISGPMGPLLALPAEIAVALLRSATKESARDAGRALGRVLRRIADEDAQRAGAPDLGRAPPLLASATLDHVVSRSGLGRLSLDLTPKSRGLIGALVRPPFAGGGAPLVSLYEGLLEELLVSVMPAALSVHCLDANDPSVSPWRFVGGAASAADDFAPLKSETGDDAAARIGVHA